MNFLAELKRRNVIRMAGLYLVGAWLIVQVAATLLPTFDAPTWVMKVLVALLAAGFLSALVFSWLYELTPEGLKRDADVLPSESIAPQTARRMDRLMVLGMLAVVAVIAADRFWPRADTPTAINPAAPPPADSAGEPAVTAEASAPATLANSIAVLPFADLSQAGDQSYFSDGMAEEILNVLTRVKGLQVASRTSSFAFKGQETLGIPAIARQLSVRHVLEGSVRRAGGTIRITAQLIDAEVDRHLWSETFDRPLTAENVFAIQDEIAQAIVAALIAALPATEVGAVGQTATTNNLGAYDSYLQARALVRSRRQLLLADELLDESLQQDAQYAPAWELRAGLQTLLGEYTDTRLSDDELEARGYQFADRALALAPDSARALAVKANLRRLATERLDGDGDLAAVIADFERSLAIDPDNTDALNWFGLTWVLVGQPEKGLAAFQHCVLVDPLASACSENEYDTLYALDRHDEAWQRYLAALDRGAITDQYTSFQMLARNEQKAAFLFASNQTRYLPRWHRHEALYEAYRNPDGDHAELVRDALAFAQKERIDIDNGYVVLLLLPLGAHDLRPVMPLLWGEDNRRYRQSPQFKHFIRESGVHDYWLKAVFPKQCQPIEPDDFRCY